MLDTTSVGVFGYSTGGGAAIEFCARDKRCDCLLTMDPFMRPVTSQTLEQGLTTPALYMFGEAWPSEENTKWFNQFIDQDEGCSITSTAKGTDHYDFSDLPLLTPLAHTIELKGPLDAERVIEIVNGVLIDFFRQTLREAPDLGYSPPVERFPEILIWR